MSIKIFVMTHKQFEAPTDSMYVPLQVGHAISPELGYLADDTGDNISRKNKKFLRADRHLLALEKLPYLRLYRHLSLPPLSHK